jgi:hypothetical protein
MQAVMWITHVRTNSLNGSMLIVIYSSVMISPVELANLSFDLIPTKLLFFITFV